MKQVLTAILLACAVFAQDAPRPSFAAASVKPNAENQRRRITSEPGGGLSAVNAQLPWLMQFAYDVQAYQVAGGPAWIKSEAYDIEATPESEANRAQMTLMLQRLLADRFRLSFHREIRVQPVYVLSAAKGSFRPPTPKEDCVPARCCVVGIGFLGGMNGAQVQMAGFVHDPAYVLGRSVIDNTGFTGAFDLHLAFAAEAAPALEPDPSRPNILAALQDQMNLKLTASKGPVEVLVIDHAERPTAN